MKKLMNYYDIMQSNYFNESYTKIEELKKDYPVNHGFIHIKNVINNAKHLAKTFNLTPNEENNLLIACSLHDIGYTIGRENHAENGALLAEKFLEENGFDENDTKLICSAIANHDGKTIENYQNKINLCLILADKLDFAKNRYRNDILSRENGEQFLYVDKTEISYKDNCLTLKIYSDDKLNIEIYSNLHHFKKIENVLKTASQFLNSTYLISFNKYKKEKN